HDALPITYFDGLPCARVIAALHLVVQTLGAPGAALAAGHRAHQACWGVAAAGLDHFVAATIGQALFDRVLGAALFARCAHHALALQTHRGRAGTGLCVDPFARVAAHLRP